MYLTYPFLHLSFLQAETDCTQAIDLDKKVLFLNFHDPTPYLICFLVNVFLSLHVSLWNIGYCCLCMSSDAVIIDVTIDSVYIYI